MKNALITGWWILGMACAGMGVWHGYQGKHTEAVYDVSVATFAMVMVVERRGRKQ